MNRRELLARLVGAIMTLPLVRWFVPEPVVLSAGEWHTFRFHWDGGELTTRWFTPDPKPLNRHTITTGRGAGTRYVDDREVWVAPSGVWYYVDR